jgi:PmbA protein
MSMTLDTSLQGAAERALGAMRAQGFDAAMASACRKQLDELNAEQNAPSLLRSTRSQRLSLVGLIDGRKAATEVSGWDDDEALRAAVAALWNDALAAPADEANAVSAGQHARIEQGPPEGDLGLLAAKVAELLAFRAEATPGFVLKEGLASHSVTHTHTLTSAGSDLASRVGAYSLVAMGSAREGTASSSFNYAGGDTHALGALPAHEHFGIGAFMRDTLRQVKTRPLAANFVGDVVLTPAATASLLQWLQAQIGDERLIAGASLFRERVGEPVASPLVTLRSRFDAPGVAAVSADGFVAAPVTVLQDGVLRTLTPSLYASRRAGVRHVPTAAAGWSLEAGATPLAEVIAAVPRGALVDRLSMGQPAPNGDFSALLKNSFAIDGGQVGDALGGVMMAGNMARMLHDVLAVSHERIDTGALVLPWLRIGGLHFS